MYFLYGNENDRCSAYGVKVGACSVTHGYVSIGKVQGATLQSPEIFQGKGKGTNIFEPGFSFKGITCNPNYFYLYLYAFIYECVCIPAICSVSASPLKFSSEGLVYILLESGIIHEIATL